MPFCSGSTMVSRPTNERIVAAAASRSYVFTQNSTRSTAPTCAGSDVAVTGIVSHRWTATAGSARGCAHLKLGAAAMKVTSSPALASSPPT